MTQIAGDPGRTVGLLSGGVPRELLYALGRTPVRVFPTAEKPTAAEDFLPRNFCAMTRLILASFVEDGGPVLEAVIFADEDDATRRLYDVWRAYMPVPAWGFVDVPRAATPLAASHYAGLLTRLAADLETHTGQRLGAKALRQAVGLYNEQRGLLADLKRRWLAGSVATIDYRRLRRMALTQGPTSANERLRQALAKQATETVQETASFAGNAAFNGHSRLLLSAELAAPDGLVRLVESHNAQVVAEDSDLDERDLAWTVPTEGETVDELLLALAQAYLDRPPSPRPRDLPRRLAYFSGLLAERSVSGVICAYSNFCDLYLAEFPSLRAHLRGLGVPVLLLELEDEAISGQHRTRVEAFLELTGSS